MVWLCTMGDIERRGSPAIKYELFGSVTETGAQQGKSSSTVTIRQTEGNGQENLSAGRVRRMWGNRKKKPPVLMALPIPSMKLALEGETFLYVTIRQTEGIVKKIFRPGERHRCAAGRAPKTKNTPPELGDADTVFADGNGVSTYVDVDADGNPVTVIKTAKALFDGAPKSAYASIAKKLIMKEYADGRCRWGKTTSQRIHQRRRVGSTVIHQIRFRRTRKIATRRCAPLLSHNLLENSTYDHWAADKEEPC